MSKNRGTIATDAAYEMEYQKEKGAEEMFIKNNTRHLISNPESSDNTEKSKHQEMCTEACHIKSVENQRERI
jgi:hypothetical protein